MIKLKKVTEKNIWKIIKLSVQEDQKSFVATNTESILQAYTAITSDRVALPFGMYEDDELIGFAMFGFGLVDETDPKIALHNYVLWRFMIDKAYQGRGLGKKALAACIDYVKTMPAGEAEYCWLSYEPENIGAKNLYASFGFQENGEQCESEIVAVLKL